MDDHQDPDWPRRVAELMDGRGPPPAPEATKATNGSRIYFIGEQVPAYIKIGVAQYPQKRLTELQCANPRKLYIHASGPGDYFKENQLHTHFGSWRYSGEWFKMNDELAWLMSRCGAKLCEPDIAKEQQAGMRRLFWELMGLRRAPSLKDYDWSQMFRERQRRWFLPP